MSFSFFRRHILAAISVISRFIQYVPTCLAVIYLRKREDLPQSPFKLPFIIPILAILISFWLLLMAEFQNIVIGLGGLVIGAIFYVSPKIKNKFN